MGSGGTGRGLTLLLRLYLFASARAEWFVRRKLAERRKAGKEDPGRIGERMGEAGLPRPEGRLVWFHAASVGKSLSLLEVLRRLGERAPALTCLVTSGTVTSADLLAKRLPEGCIHQYVPVDVRPWVVRFLEHWRPDVAVWTESELWPGMICETDRRGIPMMIINARISEKSYRQWSRFPWSAAAVLGRFDAILAQDELAARQLRSLGADPGRVQVAGSLKESSAPLPHDERALQDFSARLNNRPVWVAASTHPGEEEIVVAAHQAALRAIPGLLLLLVPRHPDRGPEIAARLRSEGHRVAVRSQGEELATETGIYLADTLGELGIWYRIAPVCFVGGSLFEIGGHNPYEPALLGSAILHGPHVRNFAEAYEKLEAAGAAIAVRDAAGLGRVLARVLSPDVAAEMAASGWDVCSEGAEVTNRVLSAIERLLRDGR